MPLPVLSSIAKTPQAASPEVTQLEQITRTHYDRAHPDAPIENVERETLRGRVAWVEMLEDGHHGNGTNTGATTHYNYDPHGNVKTLIQQLPGLSETKRTDYVYDLVSGNVNQAGETDQMIHSYLYDADNRIVRASTSTDGYLWNKEADYFYYAHGPLARTELGHYNVQGMDYYYTMQGWIKGVNTPGKIASQDPGKDGVPIAEDLSGPSIYDYLAQNPHPYVSQDAFGYALGYYKGDYTAQGGSVAIEGLGANTWDTFANQENIGKLDKPGLFNGNISWMITGLSDVNNPETASPQAMAYRYDQLNRIKQARGYGMFGGSFLTQPNMYASNYNYDANGNLTNLTRHNQQGEQIDNIVYQYDPEKKHNRLLEVDDVGYNPNTGSYDAPGNPEGLKNDSEYTYDKIGNLKTDDGEKIDNIDWTVYGKVKSVEKEGGATTSYRYDAAGNRILKTVVGNGTTTHTHYLRDASGNIMATYKTEDTGESLMLENPIYGSSRLGMYNGGTNEGYRTLANKQYELSNHLGNVLTTITDKKVGIDSDNDQVANHYIADISSISDYYPFGLAMKERSMSEDGYRFGFNGVERDDDILSEGSSTYSFKYRIHNPALGKFFSVDPLAAEYPWNSTYAFAENRVIDGIDLEGAEYLNKSKVNEYSTLPRYNMDGELEGGKKNLTSNQDGTYNFSFMGKDYTNISLVEYDGGEYFNIGKHISDGVGGKHTEWVYNPLQAPTITSNDWTAYIYGATCGPFGSCAAAAAKTVQNATSKLPGHFWLNKHNELQIYSQHFGLGTEDSRANGLDRIHQELENGNPVMVGVHYQSQNPSDLNKGTDWTTDHFVVIYQRGKDSNGVFFQFAENVANNNVYNGMASHLKFYLQSDGTLKTNSKSATYSNKDIYRVTQIRPVKE